MRLAFHHEDFDSDVSSGTIHAAHQWHELCAAFNVERVAVITGLEYPIVDAGRPLVTYGSLEDFLSSEDGPFVFVERDGEPYRDYVYPDNCWLVVGGVSGLPRADVSINTGSVSLYPREAAAIVLAEAARWQ